MRFASSYFQLALACTAGVLGARCGAPTSPTLVGGGMRVLFVGNSLTYANDLPATVAAIAAAGGDTIHVAVAAGPNLGLIDHLRGATDAIQQMQHETWTYVVLQQGPTPAGMCRDSLVLWARAFAPYVTAAGARAALFMTWPGTSYRRLFPEVRVSFQAAARALDGIFMPAGVAWQIATDSNPQLQLYGPDGFHPSATGTFLAALEIYERLTGRDARTLPPRAFVGDKPLPLPAELVRQLQRAAHDANTMFGPASAPTDPELALPSLYSSSASSC